MNFPVRSTAVACLVLAGLAHAQQPAESKPAKPAKDSIPVPRLFRSKVPLAVQLTEDFGRDKRDKEDTAPAHAATEGACHVQRDAPIRETIGNPSVTNAICMYDAHLRCNKDGHSREHDCSGNGSSHYPLPSESLLR